MGAELEPLMVQILMDFFRAYSVKRAMVRYKKDNAWIIRVRAGRILMLTVHCTVH
jgi:ketosteroid isomerase-like protein